MQTEAEAKGTTEERVKNYAKLSEGTYRIGDRDNRQQRIDDTNNMIKSTGFTVIDDSRFTNNNMTTYKNEAGEVHVAHRGTHIRGKRGIKDIRADLMFGLGLSSVDPRFKRRTKMTEKVIKQLQPDKFTMSGHSLGGGTVQHSIANSKRIRSALHEAHTFNSAANPVLNSSLQVSNADKKKLDKQVTHHRTRGDIVSAGFKMSVPFGEVKRYSIKHDEKKGKSIFDKIVKTNPVLSKIKQITAKTLHAHGLDHFSS